MRKPLISPLALQIRQLLRCSTAAGSLNHTPSGHPSTLLRREPFRRPEFHQFQRFSARFFSSQPVDALGGSSIEEENQFAKLLSDEMLKSPEAETLPLPKRLDLSFSHIPINPTLLLDTLNISPAAGRVALDFLNWAKSRPGFLATDEVYSHFVNYFGRRKDFKAIHEVLVNGRGAVGSQSFEALVDRLVRAGRPAQTVALFEKMKKDYGFKRDLSSLKFIVSRLCDRGYASYAEKMVKSLANEFFPDEYICDALISGWCTDGKLEDARRLVEEMRRGGFEPSTFAYNALLDCVCRLCRQKDPFRLQSEAQNLLTEMERNGVPRNTDTFNVLIVNLCKMRQTEDAVKLFYRMGEWSCSPDETTFIVLIKSLYRAARTGEGDEMIDRMRSAGYGDALDKKAYYEFIRILCGVERVSHALRVFEKMKEDGCKPGIKTYDLLMGKLCAHGRFNKANALYREAESSGVPVETKEYKVDPKFVNKKFVVVKKEKKRETLPEKMARKRRRLKKIRLSFVKKPKKMRRRAY